MHPGLGERVIFYCSTVSALRDLSVSRVVLCDPIMLPSLLPKCPCHLRIIPQGPVKVTLRELHGASISHIVTFRTIEWLCWNDHPLYACGYFCYQITPSARDVGLRLVAHKLDS